MMNMLFYLAAIITFILSFLTKDGIIAEMGYKITACLLFIIGILLEIQDELRNK